MCSVNGCDSYKYGKKTVYFHRFPKNSDLSLKWIQFCESKKNINVNCARICSLHFKDDDYKPETYNKDQRSRFLFQFTVPTMNCPDM